MPICPQCSATIHAGAEDQCPACGYDVSRAEALFGEGQVEFTRVVDAAGALTHRERMELMRTLENLERQIPPVALCIYITDVGQVQELRTHAHWILNHARIHHPSFGKREQHKAIEDAALRERLPGDPLPEEEEPTPGWLENAWHTFREWLRDRLHPYPPPVRQEWMLILVLDVQLEMACFSWGYRLDPYIDPDRINTCIKRARLQFREREMMTALKRVMRAAVRRIGGNARQVNRRLRRQARPEHGRQAVLAAALAPLLLCGEPGQAASPPAAPAAPQAAPLPEWKPEDYRLLISGELDTRYSSLFPPPPTKEEMREEARQLKAQRALARRTRRNTPSTETESDSRILGKYYEVYASPAGAVLIDPQNLLPTVQREDVEHVLRSLNANARFRIYMAVYKAGQTMPGELSVDTLITAAAQPCEYAVMLLYPVGNPAGIELGYTEMKPTDEQRHAWLQQVRAAAQVQGGTEGMMEALRCISRQISPLAESFIPITPESPGKAPLIPIDFKEDGKEKKISLRERIQRYFEDPANHPTFIAYGIIAGVALFLFLVWWFLLRLRYPRLLNTEPDLRLASPYGAGVSRYVRYLEGREADKEKRLF